MVYVGASNNFHKRHTQHIWELKNNRHRNLRLQSDYNAHGIDAFTFALITECDEAELLLLERDMIERYRALPGGIYNITSSGGAVTRTEIATGEIKIYPYISAVAADGFSMGAVHDVIHGKNRRKSYKGYRWTQENDTRPPLEHPRPPVDAAARAIHSAIRGGSPVERIDSEGQIVRYTCPMDAAAQGFDSSSIYRCLADPRCTHKGYHWRKVSEEESAPTVG